MKHGPAQILLVEDDEDDYLLTVDLIGEIEDVDYNVTWASSFERGVEQLTSGVVDICLVDYRIGGKTGLEFVQQANLLGQTAPIVFLTGMGDRKADMAAMQAGAYDFLQKSELTSAILDRAIRYSISQAESRRVLLEKTMLLQATLDNTGAAIAAIDPAGRMVTWNDRFLELYMKFSTPKNRELRTPCLPGDLSNIVLDETVPVFYCSNDALECDDGHILSVRRNETPDGGAVIVCHDITHHKQAERAMREAMVEAETASAAKSAFLANVSHELRTPLNAIIGFADLMIGQVQGPVGCAEYENYMGFIKQSGDALLSIINTTLDLTRVEAKEYPLDLQALDVEEIVHASLKQLGGSIEEKGIRIGLELPRAGLGVTADEVALCKILGQLLSNAVKFSNDNGRVLLEAKCIENTLHIDITDFGIGMEPEEIERAMTAFSQIDERLTRNYEGVGLGLPLARALVELHGGQLSIKTARGHGTRVTVVMPGSISGALEQPGRGERVEPEVCIA